jgi:hypothetical protein
LLTFESYKHGGAVKPVFDDAILDRYYLLPPVITFPRPTQDMGQEARR